MFAFGFACKQLPFVFTLTIACRSMMGKLLHKGGGPPAAVPTSVDKSARGGVDASTKGDRSAKGGGDRSGRGGGVGGGATRGWLGTLKREASQRWKTAAGAGKSGITPVSDTSPSLTAEVKVIHTP